LDSRRFQPRRWLTSAIKKSNCSTTALILGISYAESEARTQQSAERFLTAAARDNAWNFLRRRATKDGTFFDNGLAIA
jgi:hypothetical protein